MYDDLQNWVNFTLYDFEGSNLLKLRFVTAPSVSWITIDASSGYRSVLASPKLVKLTQTYDFTVEAFDGAMKSAQVVQVRVNLIYDPPVLNGALQDRTVIVGRSDLYSLPLTVNGRATSAGVTEGLSYPSYSTIDNSASPVKILSSPGFTIPAQVKTMNIVFTADNTFLNDIFYLTIINQVPYFVN